MPDAIAKSDPDAPLLGPPRNALLWLRAKQMAESYGRPGDFQTILQAYQMLSLAPGFAAVSKSHRVALQLGKAELPVSPAGHKYISREKKNGEWVYTYPNIGGPSVAGSSKTPSASVAPKQSINADVTHIAHPKLGFDERRSITFYQSPAFERLNNALRDPAESAKVFSSKQKVNPMLMAKKNLVSAIKKSKVSKPVVAYRGVSLPQELLKPGSLLSDQGFVSTTTSPKIAEQFARDGVKRTRGRIPVVLTTTLPKGTSALAVTHNAFADEDDDYKDEHEILLSPKTSFRVVSSKVVSGIHYVQAELVPSENEDKAKQAAAKVVATPPQVSAKSLGREAMDMSKANMGRKKPNGRREGAWAWAHREAKKRGKPAAYAVALARKVSKSLGALDAGMRINADADWERTLNAMTAATAGNMPKPSRQVASVQDAIQGLPLSAADSALLESDLLEVLEQAQTPADAMQQAMAACAYHQELVGPIASDVAARMAYLKSNSFAVKGKRMKLLLNKAKYTSRKQGPDGKWEYTYGNDGSKPSDHLATTASGKRVQHSNSSAYDSVHKAPMSGMHQAVRKEFPGYSAQDHMDAAQAHYQDRSPEHRYSNLIGQAHQHAAGAMGHPKGTQHKEDISQAYSNESKKRLAATLRRSYIHIKGQKAVKKSDEMAGISLTAGAIKDAQGRAIDADPAGITELQQLIADYDAAGVGGTQGARVIDMATSPASGDSGVPEQPLAPAQVELDGNAPTLPFGQSVEVQKSQAASEALTGLAGTLQFFMGNRLGVQAPAQRLDN